jgi:hypothetical protein
LIFLTFTYITVYYVNSTVFWTKLIFETFCRNGNPGKEEKKETRRKKIKAKNMYSRRKNIETEKERGQKVCRNQGGPQWSFFLENTKKYLLVVNNFFSQFNKILISSPLAMIEPSKNFTSKFLGIENFKITQTFCLKN